MFATYRHLFHPVMHLPQDYEVLDLSGSQRAPSRSAYTVGRYKEKRPSLYTQELFQAQRNCHIGIDLGGPAGTPVYAFYEGIIFLFGHNKAPGDYGPTLITYHRIGDVDLYALYGHLSVSSLNHKVIGQKISTGEVLGWLGEESENGGWPPHVHFQLSLQPPTKADLPGVVREAELEEALKIYPDPRLVLGPLYD